MSEFKNPPRDYILKHSTFHNILDNDIVAASFTGRLIIGPTTLNDASEMVFEPYRSITILPSNYFKFIESIKKAKMYFSEKSDEHFEMDLMSNKNSAPRFKLTASFGKWNEHDQSLFQIRQKWNFTKDKDFNENVELGLVDEIVQADPYRWTKRGVIFSVLSLDEILMFAEKYLMETFPDLQNDVGLAKKVSQFVAHATTDFKEEIVGQLEKYEHLRLKDKKDMIERVLMSLVKKDNRFAEDEFQIKHYRQKLVAQHQLLYALFNIYV